MQCRGYTRGKNPHTAGFLNTHNIDIFLQMRIWIYTSLVEEVYKISQSPHQE